MSPIITVAVRVTCRCHFTPSVVLLQGIPAYANTLRGCVINFCLKPRFPSRIPQLGTAHTAPAGSTKAYNYKLDAYTSAHLNHDSHRIVIHLFPRPGPRPIALQWC